LELQKGEARKVLSGTPARGMHELKAEIPLTGITILDLIAGETILLNPHDREKSQGRALTIEPRITKVKVIIYFILN
jgi:hypothetical protein